MKTTVQIADALLDEAKKLAQRDHVTLKALIEEGLRRIIAERKQAAPFRLRDASFGGKGIHPDLATASWDQIRDMSYGERGG